MWVASACNDGDLVPGYVLNGVGFYAFKDQVVEKRGNENLPLVTGQNLVFCNPDTVPQEAFFRAGHAMVNGK
ncbi:Hypothetical predicted protein [Cloeon dipterum]|uniref:Uncharacterized protein n=1 Tax=Cloeon dipterum TaxID=197152 RepID=A0A8S1DK41_9INSE|nr:Hypothetical predicted protein [Cloeon dipterum]